MKEGITGVSAKTPKNISLGAGTFHIGLKFETNAWNFKETCVGATKGGNSFEYVPELYEVEPDGEIISTEELFELVKVEANLTINGLEILRPELIKAAIFADEGESEDSTLTQYVPRTHITKGDYYENVAFVGRNLSDRKPIIIIFDKAICTSGFSLEGQDKEANVAEYVFKAVAPISDDTADTLPIRIYTPKATA